MLLYWLDIFNILLSNYYLSMSAIQRGINMSDPCLYHYATLSSITGGQGSILF